MENAFAKPRFWTGYRILLAWFVVQVLISLVIMAWDQYGARSGWGFILGLAAFITAGTSLVVIMVFHHFVWRRTETDPQTAGMRQLVLMVTMGGVFASLGLALSAGSVYTHWLWVLSGGEGYDTLFPLAYSSVLGFALNTLLTLGLPAALTAAAVLYRRQARVVWVIAVPILCLLPWVFMGATLPIKSLMPKPQPVSVHFLTTAEQDQLHRERLLASLGEPVYLPASSAILQPDRKVAPVQLDIDGRTVVTVILWQPSEPRRGSYVLGLSEAPAAGSYVVTKTGQTCPQTATDLGGQQAATMRACQYVYTTPGGAVVSAYRDTTYINNPIYTYFVQKGDTYINFEDGYRVFGDRDQAKLTVFIDGLSKYSPEELGEYYRGH